MTVSDDPIMDRVIAAQARIEAATGKSFEGDWIVWFQQQIEEEFLAPQGETWDSLKDYEIAEHLEAFAEALERLT